MIKDLRSENLKLEMERKGGAVGVKSERVLNRSPRGVGGYKKKKSQGNE